MAIEFDEQILELASPWLDVLIIQNNNFQFIDIKVYTSNALNLTRSPYSEN